MRRNLFGIVGTIACLILGIVVISVATCGGGDETTESTPAATRVTVGATNLNPATSPGSAGGHVSYVRRATAAELGYPSTPQVHEEAVEPGSMTPSNSPLAGGGIEIEQERLERELAAAQEEAARAEEEAARLRPRGRQPPSYPDGRGDSPRWIGNGGRPGTGHPRSPSVLHCGRAPRATLGGERAASTASRRTALPGLRGWPVVRATGDRRPVGIWVVRGRTDGCVRRKMVTFCRAGLSGTSGPSNPPGVHHLVRRTGAPGGDVLGEHRPGAPGAGSVSPARQRL